MSSLHYERNSTKFKRTKFPFFSASFIIFLNITVFFNVIDQKKHISEALLKYLQIFIRYLCFAYISNTCLRRSQSLTALKGYLGKLHSFPKICLSIESHDTELCSSNSLYIQSNPGSFLFLAQRKSALSVSSMNFPHHFIQRRLQVQYNIGKKLNEHIKQTPVKYPMSSFFNLADIYIKQNLPSQPCLSVQFSGIKYVHIVMQPSPPFTSEVFLSCKTETIIKQNLSISSSPSSW